MNLVGSPQRFEMDNNTLFLQKVYFLPKIFAYMKKK